MEMGMEMGRDTIKVSTAHEADDLSMRLWHLLWRRPAPSTRAKKAREGQIVTNRPDTAKAMPCAPIKHNLA